MRIIKLLWVDDMESWAKSAQDNLSIICGKYGAILKVVPAINGEDLSNLLMLHEYDAIVMDYNMEPNNGDKYIRDIRFEDHLEHIPIIFYSQDTNVDLKKMVQDLNNIVTVFRGNLEDKIKETFSLNSPVEDK